MGNDTGCAEIWLAHPAVLKSKGDVDRVNTLYVMLCYVLGLLVAVGECGVVSTSHVGILEGYITYGVASVPYGLYTAATFVV